MKQYVILNESLSLSKKNASRFCALAGVHYAKVSSIIQRWNWIKKGLMIEIRKSDDFESLMLYLSLHKIKYAVVVDTTSIKKPVAMLTLFHEGNEFLDSLKEY